MAIWSSVEVFGHIKDLMLNGHGGGDASVTALRLNSGDLNLAVTLLRNGYSFDGLGLYTIEYNDGMYSISCEALKDGRWYITTPKLIQRSK